MRLLRPVVRRRLLGAGVASLAALPIGFLVQRGLSFELVSLEQVGVWGLVLWPGVLLALGLAAAFLVAPLGELLARRPTGRLSDFAARTGFSTFAGTGGFYLVTGFPVRPLEASLLALPQLAFFAGLYLWLDRERKRHLEAPPPTSAPNVGVPAEDAGS